MFTAPGPRSLIAGVFAAALTITAAVPAGGLLRANDGVDPTVTGSIGPTVDTTATITSPAFREALDLLAEGKHAEAFDAAGALTDAVERRTIQWAAIYFGNGKVGSEAVLGFTKDAPDFATGTVFKTRLEQALGREKAGGPAVIDLLGGATPSTIDARIRLAVAYLAAGERDRATELARSIWVDNFLDRATEDRVRDQLGDLLDRDAHWNRAVHLMMHDRASAVERLMEALNPAQQSLAIARNAVSRNEKNAKSLLDSVDPSMQSHPVFLFSRAQRARQFELWDEAIAWLDKAKGDVPDSAEFWYERRLLLRQLLQRGEVKRAYATADGYRTGPEGRLVEAHFHAGWIALSFLKDAAAAAPHFEEMRKHSTLPDSVTQADYWLGRARTALGDTEGARAAYTAAAEYGTIYYGQLARAALDLHGVDLREMPDWQASEAGFEARDLVRGVRLLADNGHKDLAIPLLRSFAFDLQDGGELLLAARLAQSLSSHHLAISIADTAERRGFPLDLFNFPKDGLPAAQLASVDHAFVYAVARQESRFQIDAVSSAGARGLMQLMPATAKETAGKLGMAYSASRLTTDAAYNALLGSTYLKAQLETFDGSLVLAAAAYNAGAGNARKWIASFGDPRDPSIDPVVWIELIPVQETRKYVQRVLGNYLVYRARLDKDDLSIEDALRRIPG